MEIGLTLCLPRDAVTVPVARRIVDSAMNAIGVSPDSASDVTLALTEACTNVVKHAGPGDVYEVVFAMDNVCCEIRVNNLGDFDLTALGEAAGAEAEQGRGFLLMKALMDDLHFVSDPGNGTTVLLRKEVSYRPGTLLDLTAAEERGVGTRS